MRLPAILVFAACAFLVPPGPAGAGFQEEPAAGDERENLAALVKNCRKCHEDVCSEWEATQHAKSWSDPVFQAEIATRADQGEACAPCHAPQELLNTGFGKLPRARRNDRDLGVNCVTCHMKENEYSGPYDSPGHGGVTGNPEYRKVALCLSCHGRPEERKEHDHLRRLIQRLLNLSSQKEVEFLVRPPQLHIGLNTNGVVGLKEGVQELLDVDRLPPFFPFLEFLPLQKTLDGRRPDGRKPIQEPEDSFPSDPRNPIRVPPDLHTLQVEHLPELLQESFGIALDLGRGEGGTRLIVSGWIAHTRGEVAENDHRHVPEFLELAQFFKKHEMAEVEVRRGGIESRLYAERFPRRKAGGKVLLLDNLHASAAEAGKLFCWGLHQFGISTMRPDAFFSSSHV